MRSLYEPVGFTDSSLTSTSASALDTTRVKRTTGVPPIACSTESVVEVVGMGRSLSRPRANHSRARDAHMASLDHFDRFSGTLMRSEAGGAARQAGTGARGQEWRSVQPPIPSPQPPFVSRRDQKFIATPTRM